MARVPRTTAVTKPPIEVSPRWTEASNSSTCPSLPRLVGKKEEVEDSKEEVEFGMGVVEIIIPVVSRER